MRAILFVSTLAILGCATDTADEQLDNTAGGKADGIAEPSGHYTNPTPSVGQLTTLVLSADETYQRSWLVECVSAIDCPPIQETGNYKLTHSSTRHFIHFYGDDGADLGRYEWRQVDGHLEVAPDTSDQWFELDPDANACQAAGGACVPLVPDACEFGTVGDASQYSCGGGIGVQCCLPR